VTLVERVLLGITRIGEEVKSLRSELTNRVLTTDPRLSDARTPTTHQHVATTDLTATGTKSSATYLRGDNTWNTPTNTTYSEITSAEITAGTATTTRTITGRRAREIATTGLNPAPIALTDAATVTLAVNGYTLVYRLTAAGNRTIAAPSGTIIDGQRIMLQVTASGADRTITLTTGAAGAFKFGTDITALPTIPSGTILYIGCVYSLAAQRWHVIAVAGGY